MEEARKKRRQQAIRVGLTELLMVLVVICLTTFLTMLVLGYNIGTDLSLERSGLVQINSKPTGASIVMDGEEIFYHTNTSRTATSGVHMISLTKEGYDSWTKEVNVTEGYYYRLAYPRLFLKNKVTKKIGEVVSPYLMSRVGKTNSLLLMDGKTTQWQVLGFDGEKINKNVLNVQGLFTGAEQIEMLADVEVVEWSKDGGNAIIKTTYLDRNEWLWLNMNNVAESVNLTKTFGVEFTDIQFMGGASGVLLGVGNGELREIDVMNGTISKVIASNVESFDNDGEKIVFVSSNVAEGQKQRFVGIYDNGAKGIVKLCDVEEVSNVMVAVAEYFEDEYVVVVDEDKMLVYQNNLPVYGAKEKIIEPVIATKLKFVPNVLEKRGDGELVAARNSQMMAVMDMEMFGVVEYEAISDKVQWLDDYMLYSAENGAIMVFDFDGLNVRKVVDEGVKDGSAVMMSVNGKWIYYLDNNNQIMAVKVG